MSSEGEEDDYLSEKFLVEVPTTSKPTTYSQLRHEAQKKSHLKNERNRQKSRRELELEAREEGLSKSLFERAKEEEAAGISKGNKALSIMMKMGFKPGQSLGTKADETSDAAAGSPSRQGSVAAGTSEPQRNSSRSESPSQSTGNTVEEQPSHVAAKHKTEPLPLQEWQGKQGIGLGKRARSPSASERLAKMAKLAENMEHRDFRERARDEYNNRRAEGRLVPAQLTCTTLDEAIQKSFNVLWLNPNNPDTFPPGLIEALTIHGNTTNASIVPERQGDSVQDRLRKQMQADALQPINDDGDLVDVQEAKLKTPVIAEDNYSVELLEEAAQFLRLQAQDRLGLVLSYLRDKHHYCFWCGVKYESEEELEDQCPGPEEDDH